MKGYCQTVPYIYRHKILRAKVTQKISAFIACANTYFQISLCNKGAVSHTTWQNAQWGEHMKSALSEPDA